MAVTELIGLKMKTLRKLRQLTIADMSAATGLSVTYLNKVEKDQSQVTVDGIAKICAALDIRLTDFLSLDLSEEQALVRREARRTIYSCEGVIKYELLTSGRAKSIKALAVTLYPNANQGYARVCAPHTTDEFGFVLEGEMVLAVAGSSGSFEHTLLSPGDTYYVYAGRRHALKCHGDSPCVSFWSYLSYPDFASVTPSQH